jgi:hypothetical protein
MRTEKGPGVDVPRDRSWFAEGTTAPIIENGATRKKQAVQ